MNWYHLTDEDFQLAGTYVHTHNPHRYEAPERELGWGAAKRVIIAAAGDAYVLDLWDPSERTSSVRLYFGRFIDRDHYLNTLRGIGWVQ